MSAPLPNVFLALWNLDVKDPPHVDAVRAELRAAGLSEERAADVPPTTAFQRAASATRTKELDAKTFTSKESGRPRCQFESITETDGRLQRRFIGQYELAEDTDTPRAVNGTPPDEFRASFDQAKTHYTGADISKVIQAILTTDGLGAYSPRKNGGVYFVPVKADAPDMLERIARFADALSVRFLTYTIPDVAAQKAEIADAICTAYAEQIDAHSEAIATYTTETRPGIIVNRREAIQETYSAMGKLRELCNGRYPVLRERMAQLLNQLRDLETQQAARAEQEAQANQNSGRRQIVAAV